MTSTYTPTGNGLCAVCGRDVGRHVDPAHELEEMRAPVSSGGEPPQWMVVGCVECDEAPDHPIHDPGRILRCPSEITNLDRVTIYPEVK